MSTWLIWMVPGFLFALGVVVFIHELGHFLVARWCGVKVTAFSIGFGKEIWSRTDRYGTVWRIAWIPLGGYVKFMDDDNGASMPSSEAIRNMTPEQRAGSFHLKPVWQRSAIVAAGPVFNFLLAIGVFALFFMILGEQTTPARVAGVKDGGAADAAGIKTGDLITEINGTKIRSFNDLRRIINAYAEEPLTIVVERSGRLQTIQATPQRLSQKDEFGNIISGGMLGIEEGFPPRVNRVAKGSVAEQAGFQTGDVITKVDGQPITTFNEVLRLVKSQPGKPLTFTINRAGATHSIEAALRPLPGVDPAGRVTFEREIGFGPRRERGDYSVTHYGPIGAICKGVEEAYFVVWRTLIFIGDLFKGRESVKQVRGPLGIAEHAGQAASKGFDNLIYLTAVLSISIGLLNLFPIPLLDGGHLLFFAIEAVRRKPLSERTQEYGFRVGIAIVLCLMMLVFWNDFSIWWERIAGTGIGPKS